MRPWRRPFTPIIVLITAALTVGVVNGTEPPSGGGPGAANIWVDTNGGSCADVTTAVSYMGDGTECPTLAAAVAAAEPGDKIGIRTGVYPGETIAYKASLQNLSPGCDPYGEWGAVSTANCVEIFSDGDVTFRSLINNASSIWLHGDDPGTCSSVSTCQARIAEYDFHITNADVIGNPPPGADDDAACNCQSATFRPARPAITSNTSQRPDHVIVDGIDADTAAIFSSSNVLMRRVDLGPMWFDTPTRGSASGGGPEVPRIWTTNLAGAPAEIVWDGVFVHEMNRTFWCDVNNACHNDGLFINSGDDITVRNSGFTQIAGEVLFFQNFGQPDNISGVTVENSWFGCKVNSYPDDPANARTTCGQGTPFSISECGPGGCVDWLVRFNSFFSIDSASETSWSNARFVGNVGRQPGSNDPICTAAGITWTYNAFWTNGGGTNCGATNTNTGSSSQTSLIVSAIPGAEDFHLGGAVGSTVADNLVSPTSSDYTLTTDIDGATRPAGTNRDAGMDER